MAQTSLTSGSATASSAPTTASVTPTANYLVTLTVASTMFAATPNTPTVTGCGLTWVAISNQLFNTNDKITVFRAMGASPSSGAITISFASQSQDSIAWSVSEWSDIDTSGTNGSGAIVQSVNATGSSTSLLTTLSAFGAADNTAYGCCAVSDQFAQNIAPGTGFTEVHEVDVIGTFRRISLMTEYKASSDTTIDASLPTFSSPWAVIGIEIKKYTGAPSTSVKTVLGLAQASVKTVNGLAIASVKTIDGLA